MGVEIAVDIDDPWWESRLTDAAAVAETAAAAALRAAAPNLTTGGVTIALSSDAVVHDLNRRWRGVDAPTNVLSFPGDDPAEAGAAAADGPPGHWGDVVLAGETMGAEATQQGKSLADHLAHLVVHGVLHLLGYDHENDDDGDVMESLETAILADLGVADPYRGDGLPAATDPRGA